MCAHSRRAPTPIRAPSARAIMATAAAPAPFHRSCRRRFHPRTALAASKPPLHSSTHTRPTPVQEEAIPSANAVPGSARRDSHVCRTSAAHHTRSPEFKSLAALLDHQQLAAASMAPVQAATPAFRTSAALLQSPRIPSSAPTATRRPEAVLTGSVAPATPARTAFAVSARLARPSDVWTARRLSAPVSHPAKAVPAEASRSPIIAAQATPALRATYAVLSQAVHWEESRSGHQSTACAPPDTPCKEVSAAAMLRRRVLMVARELRK